MAAIGWHLLRLRFSRDVRRLTSGDGVFSDTEIQDKRAELAWTLGIGTSVFRSQQGGYFMLVAMRSFLARGNSRNVSARSLALLGGMGVNLGFLSDWGGRCLVAATDLAQQTNDPLTKGSVALWRANAALVAADWAAVLTEADCSLGLFESVPGTSWERNTAQLFATMAMERQVLSVN